MCDSSFLHCSGGRYAFACLRRLLRVGGYPFAPVLPLAARLDYAARPIRGPQGGPLVFLPRLPRLGLFRSFARRVLAALLSLVLVINVFVSPRYRAYAVIPALPVLAAGLGALGTGADVTFGGLLAAALGGAFVSAAVQGNDYWNDVANSAFGTNAVAANREFFENAYSVYQNTGSFGVVASDIPDSVVSSIVDGVSPYLQSYALPFPVSFVTGSAGWQNSVSYVDGGSAPSDAVSDVPIYAIVRAVRPNGLSEYFFSYARFFGTDASFPVSFSSSVSDGIVNLVASGKGLLRYVCGSRRSYPFIVSYNPSNGSRSIIEGGGSYETSVNSNSYVFASCAYNTPYSSVDLLCFSSNGFDISAPSVADTPSAVLGIAAGIVDGSMTTAQALPAIQTALGDSVVAVPMDVTSYGDVVLEGSAEGGGEGTGTYDGVLGEILSALGVSGPIATILSGVVSGIAALPTQLANLLFNTHIQSFSQTALDSLDDVLSQYVSSLPIWLQETGTVLDGLPSNIALAMDGNFGDVITAVNQVLEQVTGIPAEIPEAFGTIITGIPAEVWGEFEGPIGDIIDVLDGVLDGVMGIPRAITDAGASVVTGIGDLTLDIDLSGVLSAIGAIPLSISAALGLDWFIEQAQDLDERLEVDEPSALTLPSATWDDAVGVAQDFADLTPLGPFERFINGVFDVFAGESRRSVSAPRYSISMPNPFGDPFVFVVDFSIFDGTFVAVCHAVFYVCFGFWYFNFVRKLKESADSYVGELIAARAA